MIRMSQELKDRIVDIAKNGGFIDPNDVFVLLDHGFDNLPVLIRRNMGRDIILLKNLAAFLDKPLEENDYIRDVSSWPEDFEALLLERAAPHAHLAKQENWCDDNTCESLSCHRCFPIKTCTDHSKCREWKSLN